MTRKDDTLPPRIMEDAMPEGPTKGNYVAKEQLDALLDKYYAIRGWEVDGSPKKEALNRLGLKV